MSEEESNNTSPALYSFLGFSLISAIGLCIWFKYIMMPWHNNLIRVCFVVPKVDVVPYWQVNGQPFLESPSARNCSCSLLFVMGLQGLSQESRVKELPPSVDFVPLAGFFWIFALSYDIFCRTNLSLLLDYGWTELGCINFRNFLHPKGLIGIFDIGSISKTFSHQTSKEV